MRRFGLGLLALMFALALADWAPLAAQGRPGRGHGRFEGGGGAGRAGIAYRLLKDEEVRNRLGLDQRQRSALDNLLFDSAQRSIQLRADLKSLRLEMARLGKQENPDRAALEAKLEQISAVRTELARLRLDALLQVRELLSPEQLVLLRQVAKERREGRRGQN